MLVPVVAAISIHTPLAGSDLCHLSEDLSLVFQSTLPLRGVTAFGKNLPVVREFQSTLPLRGVTQQVMAKRKRERISIHTPLAGSDRVSHVDPCHAGDFNPHSPCGE